MCPNQEIVPERPVALVLGASRGLGLLIAEQLLRRGHLVVVAARDVAEVEAAARALEAFGPVRAERCDVRDRHEVGDLVGRVEHSIGPIEVLVTVAGIIQTAPAESLVLHEFEDAIETMAWGPIHAAMTVLPHMRRRGHGRIGTVTSVGGMVSPPHLLPYATAKFAAVGFSDGLASALSGSGVTATTIVPGLMRTGGHLHASFGGDPAAEYAWFAPAASLPLLSIDADRAARRIVDAVLAGRPMVVLTPLAWVGIRVRGLAPATTTRVMGLMGRLLPSAPLRAGAHTVDGAEARRRLGSPVVDRFATLGDRAARRNNG
ncbi:SDR family oxidoreductase [Terrabacter sp. Root181]|uniref:SDR family NAD(P)-dependent oxidoreductase n=1 Tax=Terrabacter sp. Root181 TaxID=1736484 RepID=UPI0006F225C3|nr:SDR family NAD(P)-dependent oxidoreductase [Terrabacter sp. Root181]KRB47764.1 short-chain dehydrogenase [Terrabacter sp. Root181]